jgi:hypothetical protein
MPDNRPPAETICPNQEEFGGKKPHFLTLAEKAGTFCQSVVQEHIPSGRPGSWMIWPATPNRLMVKVLVAMKGCNREITGIGKPLVSRQE